MWDLHSLLDEYPALNVTVREQARVTARSSGLAWETMLPRQNVNSIKLSEIVTQTRTVAADRREWGAPGRLIPVTGGSARELEMNPIATQFDVGEKEMTRLVETYNGRTELALEELRYRLPDRITAHVDAVYNRLEVDFYKSWLYNQIKVVNPQTGKALVYPLDMPPKYLVTEDWANGNAYDLFLEALEWALQQYGTYPGGCVTTLAVFKKIQEDAPNDDQGRPLTRAGLASRIRDEIQTNFTFRVEERTMEVAEGAGTDSFRPVKLWRPGAFAFLPPAGNLGTTPHAPVTRAYNYASQVTNENNFDVRGVSVFFEVKDNGKRLRVETQLNAMPLPREGRVLVFHTGIGTV